MDRKRLSREEILDVFKKLNIDTDEKRQKYASDNQAAENESNFLPYVRLSNRSGIKEGDIKDAKLG